MGVGCGRKVWETRVKTLFLDTNIVLRFLLRDVPDQFEVARKVFVKQKGRKVICLTEVIAEVVFVLEKVYEVPRKEISELMLSFVQTAPVEIVNKKVIEWTLEQYGKTKLSYVDILLAGYAKIIGGEVISFDKKLMRWQKKQ